MRKTKKLLSKIVAVILVSSILVFSMGAYGGQVVSAKTEPTNTAQKEFALYENGDGFFVRAEDLVQDKGLFSNDAPTNKIMVKESEEFSEIYVDNASTYYQEVENRQFVAVEKLSYALNDSSTLDQLSQVELPDEILTDIKDTMDWVAQEQSSPEAKVVLFSNAPGLLNTQNTTVNGVIVRIYEVRFSGLESRWVNVVKGTNVTPLILTTINEIASYTPYYLPISIMSSFANVYQAWINATGTPTIDIAPDNRYTVKLHYNMKVKYGFVQVAGFSRLKNAGVFTTVELKRIESELYYRNSTFTYESRKLNRYVNQIYKSSSYDNAVNVTYAFAHQQAPTFYNYADDLYIPYTRGNSIRKVRIRMLPPSYSLPSDWYDR